MSVRSKLNRERGAPAEPNCDESELPEGWARRRLDSIAELNPRHPNELDDSQLVTFVPMPSVSESSPDFDRSNERPLAEVRKGYTHFADGDVLFAKITPCMENGKGAVATGLKNGLGCGTTELHVIRPLSSIDPHYIYRFLQQKSVRRDAAANFTGSAGQLRVPMSFISELELPLPPLAEQRRIVAKLEFLLGKVSSNRRRLSLVPGQLKRFRQSVLAAACSGRLTADWREQNDEPYEADEPSGLDEMIAIPNRWRYCRAADVVATGTVISYGIVLPGPNQVEGVPYIRGQDIDDFGRIHTDQLWKTTPAIAAKHHRSELREGDVLLCVIRHLRVAIVPDGLDGANLTQGTVRMRPSNEIRGTYLARYLASPQAQEWMKARYIGMSMPRINVEHARDIPIAVPPLAEQHEIIRRVEKLFAFADQIEARLKQAQTQIDRLTQSLLAKAFRGELVPTEAGLARREGRSYESASELLERIRASRADAEPAKRKRGKTTKA